MNINEVMIGNILFNSITKSKSFNEGLQIVILTSIFYYISKINFKIEFFQDFFNFNKTNKLVFSSSTKDTSKRFRAIMHFISKKNDVSIKKLVEILDVKYCNHTGSYEETKKTGYRVDQTKKFLIDKPDIYGIIYKKDKEIIYENGKSRFEEIIYLEVFSNNLSLVKLQEWVEEKLKDYEILIRSKTVDKQLLVEVAWGQEDMKINYNSWTSNVKFENRFFTNKEQILDKIKFFIENPEWYNERGIPWTLGFLLWGKPGCGKTGFIKALMNLTKRSAISIKLNNKFNINKLKRIIYDDEINEDLIISQNNRIIIFEDIDCMGDIVVDRDIKNNDKTILEEALKLKYKDKDDLQKISLLETNNDNNLSNILNILDGIQECPGRIIIMTTNKPDILDPALIRSGRIDYKIEFTFATLKDVENIVKFYWDYHEEIKLNSVINLKYSHADIVNFCRLSNDIFETINHLD